MTIFLMQAYGHNAMSKEYAEKFTAYCLLPTPYWNSATLKRPHPLGLGSNTTRSLRFYRGTGIPSRILAIT